jgi:hypothetical protein
MPEKINTRYWIVCMRVLAMELQLSLFHVMECTVDIQSLQACSVFKSLCSVWLGHYLNRLNRSFLPFGFCGWSPMYNFGFRWWAASYVENNSTFRQILQLPSSGWLCNIWASLAGLYMTGNGLRAGFYGADLRSGGAARTTYCMPYIRLPKTPNHLHTHSQDGNCNVCQNIGYFSAFNAAHPRKPKLYIDTRWSFALIGWEFIFPLTLNL